MLILEKLDTLYGRRTTVTQILWYGLWKSPFEALKNKGFFENLALVLFRLLCLGENNPRVMHGGGSIILRMLNKNEIGS